MTPQTKPNTDDVRIKEIKELVPPAHVFREYPVSNRAAHARRSTASCTVPTTACWWWSGRARSMTRGGDGLRPAPEALAALTPTT
jgi:hypothetical protein